MITKTQSPCRPGVLGRPVRLCSLCPGTVKPTDCAACLHFSFPGCHFLRAEPRHASLFTVPVASRSKKRPRAHTKEKGAYKTHERAILDTGHFCLIPKPRGEVGEDKTAGWQLCLCIISISFLITDHWEHQWRKSGIPGTPLTSSATSRAWQHFPSTAFKSFFFLLPGREGGREERRKGGRVGGNRWEKHGLAFKSSMIKVGVPPKAVVKQVK